MVLVIGDQRSDEPIRVVALTPTGVYSGAESVLLGHARRGAMHGDHWTIAGPDGPSADRFVAAGVDRVRIPELKLGTGPRVLAAGLLMLRQLWARRLLRRELREADVIVANSVMCLPVLRVARPAAPVAWLVHDVITRNDLRRLARLTASAVDQALPVSEAAGDLARRLGVPTRVVRNGVDVPPCPAPPSSEPVVVGLNGVLTHWKGQHVLLEAAARARSPFVVELLGGTLPKDGEYEATLRRRALRSDLAGRVRFLGHRDDASATMARWTVAVSASVEPEAGPLAVLEAMALGRPVVVTDHGGAPEVAAGAGFVVAPDDPDALAHGIDELLGDGDRAGELGRRGRDVVVASLQRDDAEQHFRQALLDLTHGDRR